MDVSHALLSVADTVALDDFARILADKFKVTLLATPRTAAYLKTKNVPANETAGLFSLGDATDPTIRTLSGDAVQLVVVNFPPPFVRPPEQMGFDLLLEGMDVVGPTLVRAAITRYERTCVVVDPADYEVVVQELMFKGDLDLPFCRKMARKALTLLAKYEGPLMRELTTFDEEAIRQEMPEILLAGYTRHRQLKAGSNRHQEAWLYRADDAPPGTLPKTMNYSPTGTLTTTRARDATLAMELLAELDGPAAMILARQRPIRVAMAPTLDAAGAWVVQYLAPNLSNAVLAFNGHLTAAILGAVASAPMDMLIAPSLDPGAFEPLQAREGLLLLATGDRVAPDHRGLSISMVAGAMLVEERDARCANEVESGDPGGRRPTEGEKRALAFAWAVAKYARSEAIVIAREDGGLLRTVGIAAGEISRRLAIERALSEAGADAAGAVLASDGPIASRADLERLGQAGIVAVAHPGGPEDGRSYASGPKTSMAVVATNVSHIRY